MDPLAKVQQMRLDKGRGEDDVERLLFLLQHCARPVLFAIQIARVFEENEEVRD